MPSCVGDETRCAVGDAGLACVRLATDRNHCGGCGRVCGPNEVCANGTCAFMCAAGTTECRTTDGDGGTTRTCAELSSDRVNCGACGAMCPAGYGCTGGRCRLSCNELLTACPVRASGDAGVDAGDVPAGPDGGALWEPETCTDVNADPRNCGACGTACSFGQVCLARALRHQLRRGLHRLHGRVPRPAERPRELRRLRHRLRVGRVV